MNKNRILYAEDEQALGMVVQDSLESRGFVVDYKTDGKQALEAYYANSYDILVLDVMMPELDGFSMAREIRKTDTNTPIIFLTAKSLATDVVEGFQIGANDYLKKPFSMEELIVRIQARIGSSNAQNTKKAITNQDEYQLGEYTFSVKTQELIHAEASKQLTHRESELLRLLCEKRNQVLDRQATLKQLWGDDDFFNARSMDVFITKLRKYLKHDSSIQIINIRGIGYKLVSPD